MPRHKKERLPALLPSLLFQALFNQLGHCHGLLRNRLFILAFNHDANHGLCARSTDQHPASP